MDSNQISKLAYAVLILENQPELIDEIVEFQKNIHRRVDRLVSNQKGLACKKGCDYCCYGWEVKATIPELFLMVKQLNSLTEEKRVKIYKDLKDYTQKPHDEWKKCPFLENSLCAIYDARPFVCRTYSSYDESLCKEKKEFTFPKFIKDAVEIVKNEENKITEELKPLFETKASILNIQFDEEDKLFYINLLNRLIIKPL